MINFLKDVGVGLLFLGILALIGCLFIRFPICGVSFVVLMTAWVIGSSMRD